MKMTDNTTVTSHLDNSFDRLRGNEIQRSLWDYPVHEVLEWEHLRAADDSGLRGLVKGAITRFDYRPIDYMAPDYARNQAYNDCLFRLRAYAEGKYPVAPVATQIGYLTHETIAKDLARLMQF
jgi:hypothetical protein